jgi:hypothetical protein
MNRRLTAFALSAVLALVAPLAAWADDVRTTTPGPHAAQITGSPGFPNQDIFEVRFVEINGNNIVPREFIWLEPGTYSIRVAINAKHTRPPQRRLGPPREELEYNVIYLELEAGKTYHIRARYNRDERNLRDQPYSVILYKVE